jgi:prophage antirepressor-like protein
MTDILTFSNAAFNIECIVVDGLPWFKGKQVATILGYANTMQAIRTHVEEDDRRKLDELDQLSNSSLQDCSKNATFINEPGLYSLAMRSDKPMAKIFKRWVMSEVLPSIRKTGVYRIMDVPQQQQIKIYNENDLHKKVIEFLRNHLPGHIVVPGLGELQDTVQKRSQCYYKGYRGGQPDLLILNNHKTYRGFAIELKTPKGNGQMSEKQQLYMDMLHQNGFKTLVSNDYDEVVVELTKYFQDVRFKCNHCPKAFKTTVTQETHERCMHGKRARLTND